MTDAFIQCLVYALMCLGSAWLIRAGMFALLADTARIALPTSVAVLASTLGQSLALVVAITAVAGFFLLFFAMRERLHSDDILVSIGIQAFALGCSSLAAYVALGVTFFDQPPLLARNVASLMCAGLFAIGLTVYGLQGSNLRVVLANASVSRRPTATFPHGFVRARALALAGAWMCLCLAAVLPMSVERVSLNQWQDGRGILLFGVAYALRGRAMPCLAAGTIVALAQVGANAVTVTGIAADLLSLMPLLTGMLVIVAAMIHARNGRPRRKVRLVRIPAHPRALIEPKGDALNPARSVRENIGRALRSPEEREK